MKKLLLLLISVLFLAICFSGCSKKSTLSPDNPVTLTMWHVYGDQADSPMNKMIEDFNATVGQEKGIVITVTNVSSTSKIRYQLLDAQAGKPGVAEMPDLFSCHTNMALALGVENLVNWNDYFTVDELADYIPEFIEDGTMEDSLSVFPVSKSTYALFVNGSQFERFAADTGVTYDMLSTWDGFFDVAEEYYVWSGGKPICTFDYFIRHIELDMQAKDGKFVYTEDGWYDFTNPSLYDSWMKFAKPMVKGHIAIAEQYSSTHVMTGETLIGIGSTAGISYYNDIVTYPDNTSEPMSVHVLPLPKTGIGQEYMPQTGVGMCAYKSTEQKAEAASVFLHWFTEGKRNLEFVSRTGYMPVNNEAFDAIEAYTFENDGYASLYSAIHTMGEEYTPVVRPDFDNFYESIDVLYAGLREMQPELQFRANSGEDIETLAEETWTFFQSVR